MVLIKVMVLLARIPLITKVSDLNDHVYDIEVLKEKRQTAKKKGLSH